MKKILLLLFLPFSVLGQSFETQIGKIMDGSELRDIFQVQSSRIKLHSGSKMGRLSFFDAEKNIGYQGFGFSSRKGFEIGEFSNYIHLTGTRMLGSEVKITANQKVYIHGFLNITNDFFILYSVNDKENNEERVYVNQLSREMLMLGNPILLMTFEEKRDSSAPLYFTSSPDKKVFAVVREYLHRGVTEKIQIKAFDQGFNELYKTNIDVSKRQDLFVLNDVAITNTHNLYLFGRVDPRADNIIIFAGAKNKVVPYMMTYNAESEEVKQVQISEPDVKHYYDFKFFITEENEAVAVSVYSAGRAVGYSVYHISDQTLDKDWEYTGTLSPEAYSIARKYRSKKKFLEVVSFTKLLSGEYTFSLESNFQTANRTRSFSNSGSIILVGLNQKGSMMWEKIIYKHQRIPDTKLHSSHTAFATGSGLLIVFNDDAENLSLSPFLPKFKKLKKTKKAVAVGVEVNAKGEMKKFPLIGGQNRQGFVLDMYHFPEIKKALYQFRLSKYGGGMFGKFETAYGKLQL